VAILLHIDTAISGASVCISRDDQVLHELTNPEQRDSAAWLQVAIRDLLSAAGMRPSDLSAVSVSSGPGSYTGLRVGMASAKGLCYALNIPLIALPTLDLMARAVSPAGTWLCPMIDARRMEVFTALYDEELRQVLPVHNLILDKDSFSAYLAERPITFFGNGSAKFEALLQTPHARFRPFSLSAAQMAAPASEAFAAGQFADLAYEVPLYGKEFYTPAAGNPQK